MLNNFQPAELVRRIRELRQPRLGPDGMPAVDQPWYKTPVPVVAATGVATLVIGGLIAGPKVVEAVGPPKEAEVVAAEVPAGPPPAPVEGTVEAPAPGGEDVDVSDLVRGRDARPAAAAPGLRQVGAPIGNAPAPPAPEPEPEAPEPEAPPPAPKTTEDAAPAQSEPLPTPTGNWNLSRRTPAAPPADPAPPVDTRPDPEPEPAPPAAPAPPVDTRPDPTPEPTPDAPEPPAPPTPDAPEPAPEPTPDAPEPSAPPAPETPKPTPDDPAPEPSKPTTTGTPTTTTKPAPSTTATPEPPKDGPVTYRVDGTGKAKVTYLGAGGNPVTETVSLPWSKTIPKGVDHAKAKITAEDEDGKALDGAVEFKSTAPARPSEKVEEKREWIPSDRAGDDRGAKSAGAPSKSKEAERRTAPKDDGVDSYGTS